MRAIGHTDAMRWSAQTCVCICASDPRRSAQPCTCAGALVRSEQPRICICASDSVTKRVAVHLHICEQPCDEVYNRTSAYVQAIPRRNAQLRICACASAQRRSAQPCTCACNHRRSAQTHICICASGAATNRIAVRLYLCKRPRNESHSHASARKWAINAAPHMSL